MIDVNIDIKCPDRETAAEKLEDIARDIRFGDFGASCSKAAQAAYGGSVFVTGENR